MPLQTSADLSTSGPGLVSTSARQTKVDLHTISKSVSSERFDYNIERLVLLEMRSRSQLQWREVNRLLDSFTNRTGCSIDGVQEMNCRQDLAED